MPAKSKAQQMAAGAALSAKRGATPKSILNGASRQMSDTMSEDEMEKIAATSRKTLPVRKTAKKAAARRAAPKAAHRAAPKKAAPKEAVRKTATRKTPARKVPMTRQDRKRAAHRVVLKKRAAKKARRAV